MKIFIYKTIIVLVSVFILFKITVGQTLKNYENKILSIKSKENRENILNKIKEEIKSANNKDQIFSDEEKVLIYTFINKIKKEIGPNNSK
mgnify:FL=1